MLHRNILLVGVDAQLVSAVCSGNCLCKVDDVKGETSATLAAADCYAVDNRVRFVSSTPCSVPDHFISWVLFGGNISTALSAATAAATMVFSLLYTPCVAAIASVKRELGAKWAAGVVVWQCLIAWVAAWITYLIVSAV